MASTQVSGLPPDGLTKSQARHAVSMSEHLADKLHAMYLTYASIAREGAESFVGWNREVANKRFTTELQADIRGLNRIVEDMLPELNE